MPKMAKIAARKAGIAGQAGVGRHGAGEPSQAIDAMPQPVLGDVTVAERVDGDGGKAKQEEEAQSYSRQRRPKKETRIFAQQFAHAA